MCACLGRGHGSEGSRQISYPPLTFQALLALLDQIVQVPKQVAQQQRSV